MRRAYCLLFLFTAVIHAAMPARAQSCPAYAPSVTSLYAYCGLYDHCQPAVAMTFYVNATIQSCDTVQWDFGDGSTASVTGSGHVDHTYAATGTYAVKVTVTNTLGSVTRSDNFTISKGFIAFDRTTLTFHESPGLARLLVVRSAGVGTAKVDYATVSGSALANVRFTPVSGTLSFGPGETTKNIDVPLITDNVWDPFQFFYVQLTNADSAWDIDPGSSVAQVRIVDDATPARISPDAYVRTVLEGIPFTVNLVRSGDTVTPVAVSYTLLDDHGAQVATGLVSFASGETTKSFVLTVPRDNVYTGTRYCAVSLSSTSAGAQLLDAQGLPTDKNVTSVVLQVQDVDPPVNIQFVQFDAFNLSAREDVGTLQLGLTRSGDVNPPVTIGYGIGNYIGDSNRGAGNVTFAGGQTHATIPIPIAHDTIWMPDRTFYVTLNLPPNGTHYLDASGARLPDTFTNYASKITITDDTSAANVTFESFDNSVHEKAGPATIGVLRSSNMVLAASIKYAVTTTSGGSILSLSGSVSFAANQARAVITFPVTDILVFTGDRTVFVDLMATPGVQFLDGTGTPLAWGTILASKLRILQDTPPPSPALAAINPMSGGVTGGTNVTLTGTNLTSDCSVAFGGVPATSRFVDASTMTVTTPPHVAGTVGVALACSGGSLTLPNAFTYIDASPALADITPSFGGTGGGTLVRLTGTNFRPGCWPFFDGAPAKGAKVSSPASMTASTPPHVLGNVDVSVRCGPISFTLANGFSYLTSEEPAPVVTGVDPLAGAPGQSVTILGVRFRSGDTVTFGSTPATILAVTPEALVVRIPDLPPGKIAVTVADDKGHVSTTGPIFTVTEPLPLQITWLTPSAAAPGAEIAIEGNGFRPGYIIAFGGKIAPYVLLDYTHVVVRLPKTLAAGTYAAEVWNANGQTTSTGPSLTVVDGAIVINSISPRCATNDGNVAVTINGRGFVNGATVTFNGIAANVKFVDAQTLIATAPPNTTGPARVVVTNPNGDSASLSDGFRYDAPPDPDGGCALLKRRAAR